MTADSIESDRKRDSDDIFDRQSRFVPDFPNNCSEEAKDVLERVHENSDEAAVCIPTVLEPMYYIFTPDDELARFDYKSELDCYKLDRECSEKGLIRQIHARVSNGTSIGVVPKSNIDRTPTWE